MEFLLGLPIYFFSVRLYPKSARNASIRKKHKVVTTNANGHINQSFVDERTHENGKIANGNANNATLELKKKQLAPLPPVIHNEIQNSPKTVTTPVDLVIALAALDDVLSVAEQNSRKVSVVSSVSNASGSKEESVVALIHREDIKSSNNSPLIENAPSKLELLSEVKNQNSLGSVKKENESQNVSENHKDRNSESNLGNEINNNKQVISKNTEMTTNELNRDTMNAVVPVGIKSSSNESPPLESTEISSYERIVEKPPENTNTNDNSPDSNVESKNETNEERSALSNVENDHDDTLSPPAPPPLLMNLFDAVEEVKLPRVSITPTAKDLKSVKLKKRRPKTPPADYTIRGLHGVLKDDHISFGSKDMEDFKSVLSKKLFQNGNPVQRQNSFGAKKLPNNLPKNNLVNNQFVIKDKLDIGNAKNTINEMLLKRNSVNTRVVPESPKPEIDQNVEPPLPELNEENVKMFQNLIIGDANVLDHKRRMASTLKSIRLRKVDSFRKEQ